MKRLLVVFFVFVMAFSFASADLAYAGNDYKDTPIDSMGDWFATLGKDDLAKKKILAERKATRMAKHAERKAAKAKKQAEKKGKEMKKKMGL